MSEVLLNVYRGELVENIHRGDIVVIDQRGQVCHTLGEHGKVTYWRSAAKPVQVLPLLVSGAAEHYGLNSEELAIMAASHSGEAYHVEVIQRLLAKAGLTEQALLCGTHPPFHRPTADTLMKEGLQPTPAQNACSGKHTAMLLMAQYHGWSLDDYYQIGHPVQQYIITTIAEVAGYPADQIITGIDGCGVPVFGLPLAKMALVYSRLVNQKLLPEHYRFAANRVVSAMLQHPELVAGTRRLDTDLMKVTEGRVLAKSGADGVFCLGIPGQYGIAIKVENGDMKVLQPIVIEVLTQLGVLAADELEQLKDYHYPVVKNHRREIVGRYLPAFKLK